MVSNYLSTKIKYLSFISIIMVVYIHSTNLTATHGDLDINVFVQNFIGQGITRIAVPMFFAISGFLFFNNFKPSSETFFHKARNRTYSLALPYLIWSIWGLFFFYSLQCIPMSKGFFANQLITNYTIPQILNTIFINPLPYQFWFIRDLIIYTILSPLIYLLISRLSYFSLIPFFVLWCFGIPLIFISNEGILFFSFGSALALKPIPILIKLSKRAVIIVSLLWIAVTVADTILISQNYVGVAYLHKVGLLLGLGSMWFGYDLVKHTDSDKLLWLSRFTFFIFAAHEPILIVFKKVLLKIFGVSVPGSLATYLIAPLFTIITTLGLAYLLRRFIHPIYRVLVGGRI